ncbi:hypothetical protein ABZ914_19365, partial [Spirillospora sp. NPDC046719]
GAATFFTPRSRPHPKNPPTGDTRSAVKFKGGLDARRPNPGQQQDPLHFLRLSSGATASLPSPERGRLTLEPAATSSLQEAPPDGDVRLAVGDKVDITPNSQIYASLHAQQHISHTKRI